MESNCSSSPFNNTDVLEKIKNAWKYHEYRDALFFCSTILSENPTYNLLYAILLFYNKEYKQCIEYCLHSKKTMTRHFYAALAFKELKMYEEVRCELRNIINGSEVGLYVDDVESFGCLADLFILPNDNRKEAMAFVYKLIGETYLLDEQVTKTVEHYESACNVSNLTLFGIFELFMNEKRIKIAKKIDESTFAFYKDEDEQMLSNHLVRKKCPVSTFFYNLLNSERSIINKHVAKCNGLSAFYFLFYHRSPESTRHLPLKNISDSAESYVYNNNSSSLEGIFEHCCHVLEKEDHHSGLEYLAYKFLKNCPDDYRTWLILGIYFFDDKQYTVAIRSFLKSLQIYKSYQAFKFLGIIHELIERYMEASTFYSKSCDMHSSNTDAFLGLAKCYAIRNKNDLALLYFKKAFTGNPLSKKILLHFVRFHIASKQYHKVCSLISDFFTLESKSNPIIFNYLYHNMNSDLDELLSLEFAELIIKTEICNTMALKIIDKVCIRDSSYYSKKCLLEKSE